MKFSIIIPAYNAENHIKKALDSIASQTYKDYELIVICDSCTDNTEQIAQSYGAITRAVNFHCDGPSRSLGLDIATGDWVLFMDDDDWWLHEFVLEQLAEKLDNTDCDVLAFSFIWKHIGYTLPIAPSNEYYPAVWNKCWKRSCIGYTRFPKIYSISDYHFHLDMMKKCPKIVVWEMPLYYYNYLRKGSISQLSGQSAEETRRYVRRH